MNYPVDSIKNDHVRGFVTSLLASSVVISASAEAFLAVVFAGSASATYGDSTSLAPTSHF